MLVNGIPGTEYDVKEQVCAPIAYPPPRELSLPGHPWERLARFLEKIYRSADRYIRNITTNGKGDDIFHSNDLYQPDPRTNKSSLIGRFHRWWHTYRYGKPRRKKEPVLKVLELFYPSLKRAHTYNFIVPTLPPKTTTESLFWKMIDW